MCIFVVNYLKLLKCHFILIVCDLFFVEQQHESHKHIHTCAYSNRNSMHKMWIKKEDEERNNKVSK